MSEHTPTTEEVRDTYTWGASACGCCAEYRDEDYEKFDLWLAALIREAKAEAWDEGYITTEYRNPYREGSET